MTIPYLDGAGATRNGAGTHAGTTGDPDISLESVNNTLTTTVTGAPITGQSLEAGGSGVLGWLSSIRKAITDRLPAALTGSGNLKVSIAESTVTQPVSDASGSLTVDSPGLPTALGQAVSGASMPVVLPAAQITTLTPPAAITGFATAANQTASGSSLSSIDGKLPTTLTTLGDLKVALSEGVRASATGTAGSLNADAIASTDVRAYNVAIIQFTGTWAGIVSPQLSNDNVNFVTVSGYQLGGSIPATGVIANGILYVPLVGDYFRVRFTTYTSGTVTVNVSYTTMPFQALSTFVQIGGTPAVTATGNVAAGVSDSGSPVKTGGIYSTTLPTLTNGQRGNTQIEVNGVASVQGYGYGNGATPVALRTPETFKDLAAVAITTIATVWTPTTGKKFRLMGMTISVSSACSVLFEDNTAGNTVFRTPQLAANSPYNVDLANGVLSATINNVLKATASTGTVTITGTLYGIEV